MRFLLSTRDVLREATGRTNVVVSGHRGILDRIETPLRRDQDRTLPTGPIDNSTTERALRMVAVGRSNWTQSGSEAGAKWAATFYGLLGTCKRQGKDPFAWLNGAITRVRDHPADRMHELTPRLSTPANQYSNSLGGARSGAPG